MKQVATIFLLLTIGIQTFSKWIIVFGYEINKEYIAKNICVNRKNPMNSCNGKCYLTKRISADEERQQPAGKASYQKDLQLDYLPHQPMNKYTDACALGTSYNPFHLAGIPIQHIDAVFQPPRIS